MPSKPIVRSSKLIRLINEAKNLSRERGHTPTNARLHPNATHAIIECSNPSCHAWVQVSTKPAANEIDLGGPMIAEGCPVALVKRLWQKKIKHALPI